MGPIYSWNDFVDMTRRRLAVIFFVTILGCIVSFFWALNMQHLYVSQEVIQIEQPKIASDLARTTVQGSSARRLQLIEQQLMARDNLEEIIAKYGLYGDIPGIAPSTKVDFLRRSITINGVAAVREGFADDGTITILSISAEMVSGDLAQAVAHEFADRTRALSVARRQGQTAETLAFFTGQEDLLLRDIAKLEAELEEFRNKNDLSLEGGVEFRLREIASLNVSILELDSAIIGAELAKTQIDRSARAATVARLQAEIEDRLETLTRQRGLLSERRASLRTTVETSPEVERELGNFDRRMDQLQGQLSVVNSRRNEAEVSFSLESSSQGERMITLEEARIPDYPITPSKKRRAIMGAVAALGAGFFLALLLELRRPVIRTARQMARETGVTPVVSIPVLDVPDSAKGWRKRRAARQERGRAGRNARIERHP